MDLVLVFFKGIFMGSADIVPGVSGGTIALITGIYERLVNSIKSIDLRFILYFVMGFSDKKYLQKSKDIVNKIDYSFLIVLILGIAFAFLSLAKILVIFLESYPGYTYAFFLGLIISSAFFIFYSNKKNMNVLSWVFIIFGFILGFSIVGVDSIQADHSVLIIFLSGMITFCAMILPGISGAFILLLMGQYNFMLDVLSDIAGFNFSRIIFAICYIAGGFFGILLFSRVLSYLLEKHNKITYSFVIGLMIGALRKPIQFINIESDQYVFIFLSCLVGVMIVVLVIYFAKIMTLKGE